MSNKQLADKIDSIKVEIEVIRRRTVMRVSGYCSDYEVDELQLPQLIAKLQQCYAEQQAAVATLEEQAYELSVGVNR